MASQRLRDFIVKIRQCKNSQQEREAVQTEGASIRSELQNRKGGKQRSVAKLLFIYLLGYPVDFATFECLNMMASRNYIEKRIGYLAINMLFDESNNMFFMVTNTLQQDLYSNDLQIVNLALSTIGNIGSADMCRDLTDRVIELFQHENPQVKKRAALAGVRIVRKCPELLETVATSAGRLLEDTSHAVVGGGVSLMQTVLELEPKYYGKFEQYTPRMLRALNYLLAGKKGGDHEHRGLNNPFLQCQILCALNWFNVEQLGDVQESFRQVFTKTDYTQTSGHAVVYEVTKTIVLGQYSEKLLETSAKSMGNFLSGKNNQRYVALKCFHMMTKRNIELVDKYKEKIFYCLDDPDLSIQLSALRLIAELVNTQNLHHLVERLMVYLPISDGKFKEELAQILSNIVEHHQAAPQWKFDIILGILNYAGSFITDEIIGQTIDMAVNNESVQSYIVHTLYRELKANPEWDSLWKLGIWCIGEFCTKLILPAKVGEKSFEAIANDPIIELFESLLNQEKPIQLKEYTLTALGKLATMIPSIRDDVKMVLQTYSLHWSNELQQRACELQTLLNLATVDASNIIQKVPMKLQTTAVVKEAPAQASSQSLLDFDEPTYIDMHKDSVFHIKIFPSKVDSAQPEFSKLTLSIQNLTSHPISQFSLTAAVPNYITLNLPQFENYISASSEIKQDLHVMNSLHREGQPLALKLWLNWDNGALESQTSFNF